MDKRNHMDQKYVMKGGIALRGEVAIAGAKNAALGILAGALMADEPVFIEQVPEILDVEYLLDSIRSVGVVAEKQENASLLINGSTLRTCIVDDEFIQQIRGGYYLVGALLGKCHHAEVMLPGGCNIGNRPVDQHIKGFRMLGAEVRIRNGMMIAKCDHLRGAHIYLDVESVGATINIMLAAVLAEGKTVIENAAKEPHVVDVANLLNCMGANVKGAGTDMIRINGVHALHGCTYTIIPDQIEAGTFMIAAAMTRGDVTVRNVTPKHLDSISSKLREIGCRVEEGDDSVRVIATDRPRSTHIKTQPYPGFPTDMQPQITALLSISEGTSVVTESIFENRYKYVDELTRMGACIKVEGNVAVIDGVNMLTGAKVTAMDLRAGAALVIAGLAAEGFTVIEEVRHIERGYENFVEKLKHLGAMIERVDDDRAIQKFKYRAG